MYGSCIVLGMSPSEIWQASIEEVCFYIDTMRPKKTYGRMTEDDAKRLTDRIKANPSKYL